MRMRVEMGEPLWHAVGQTEVAVEIAQDKCTIAEVLLKLCDDYPDFEAAYQRHADGLAPDYILYLNARALPNSAAPSTKCVDGDLLRIILPKQGGA